jgi:hypothetical protein
VLVIFIWVFVVEGIDSALKAYSALGSIVGVITGSMATYFFTRETVINERAHRDRAEQQAQTMMAAANDETIEKARRLRPDLFGPTSGS